MEVLILDGPNKGVVNFSKTPPDVIMLVEPIEYPKYTTGPIEPTEPAVKTNRYRRVQFHPMSRFDFVYKLDKL